MLRTVGIHLAPRAEQTVSCAVQWYADMALVETPVKHATDTRLLAEMDAASWVGLDAPLGWPEPFVHAISHYASYGAWPEWGDLTAMPHRLTDRAVRAAVRDERDIRFRPTSVSSSPVAAAAWRAGNLLRQFTDMTGYKLDRIGIPFSGGPDGPPMRAPGGLLAPDGLVEVQPSAALAMWGLPHQHYRAGDRITRSVARGLRAAIVAGIETKAAGWLVLADETRRHLLGSDRCLDAFLSALVAMAAARGETLPPDIEQRGAAHFEGWIHLPEPESLTALTPAGL